MILLKILKHWKLSLILIGLLILLLFILLSPVLNTQLPMLSGVSSISSGGGGSPL